MSAVLREPWSDLKRQEESAVFGTWLLLGTELLFFGGLFASYAVYRFLFTAGFLTGARQSEIVFGASNTAILLTSSFAMAVGVRAARAGSVSFAQVCFYVTAALGLVFLVVKGFEYSDDIAKHLVPGPQFPIAARGAEFFWTLYWVMTLIHAIHVAIGIGAVLRLPLQGRRRREWLMFSPAVEVTGLYWHFVDAIWIVLFPLLYLAGRAP